MSDHYGNNGNSKIAGIQGLRGGESPFCCLSRLTIFSCETRFPCFVGEAKEEPFKRFVAKVGKDFSSIKTGLRSVLTDGDIPEVVRTSIEKMEGAQDSKELIRALNGFGKLAKEQKIDGTFVPKIGRIFGIWAGDFPFNGKQREREVDERRTQFQQQL